VDAPGEGGRALAARYAASMRLARLTGMDVSEPELAMGEVYVPDPMADLDDGLVVMFQRLRRSGRLTDGGRTGLTWGRA
jgi:hypothetical protein